jgi:hypothetical protein
MSRKRHEPQGLVRVGKFDHPHLWNIAAKCASIIPAPRASPRYRFRAEWELGA